MTYDGHIEARPRMHDSVSFKFRVYGLESRAAVVTKIAGATATKGEQYAAMAIASHIMEWDIAHPETKDDIPITAENVLRLHPAVGHRLYRIVMGDEPPDALPGERDDHTEDDTESEFAAAINGQSPGEAREKNLSVV